MAVNKIGSCRMSHDKEIKYKVLISKIPLGEGLKVEFMEILRIYLVRDVS